MTVGKEIQVEIQMGNEINRDSGRMFGLQKHYIYLKDEITQFKDAKF